jgi:NarL family two-component system response regulator LiaR
MKSNIGKQPVDSNNTKVSILLVDDHPLVRHALKDILEKEKDFMIVGEAENGEDAVMLASSLSPAIIVMDISMPKLDGLEATRQIKAKHPDIAVLVLTMHTEDQNILEILQAGAAGYLLKSVFGEEIVNAIRSTASGDMVLSPKIGQHLLKHAGQYPLKPIQLDAGETLSTRELEVLKMTACGMSNKEIASSLGMSLRTVKGHLTDVFEKLRVSSRTEAVITGLRAGYLAFDEIK